MINHILSNLLEKYENIIENLEDNLDDNIDMLNMKKIWDKLSSKYDIMNALSNKNEGIESEKPLYSRQIKGMCYNCGIYEHNSRDYTGGKENKYCMYYKIWTRH